MKLFTLIFAFLALGVVTLKAQVSFVSNEACYGALSAMQGSNASLDTVASWLWDFDNDGVYDDASGQNTNYIFNSTTTVTVGLVIVFTNGGGDTITQNVVINPLPEVNFYVDNLCADDSATFTDNSSIASGTIVSYFWDFDNDGSADEVGPQVLYNHGVAGIYVTSLECVSDVGCKSSTAKQNEVYSKPNSDFTTMGSSMVGEPTVFINNSGIVSGSVEIYVWDFGDGKGSSVEEPSHDWDSAMTFTVQLVSISDQDCRDTLEKDIVVAEALEIQLPLGPESEVVTPNGDLINDYLKINGLSRYTGCSVVIYNIWNEKIYDNPEYDNVEDNSFSGAALDAGAYYYVIRCDEEEVMGVINILR